ncbi:MAG TPA: hypothetical protein PKE45_17395 [Caldilineaceae bacterium]|nr:hypothetical protein [Caldilineaceae bacterium]
MRSRIVWKVISVFLIGILIGVGIGQQQALAESKGVWVSPVGTVGTASTTGFPSQGSVGRSSSTVTLNWLRAHIKIWHTGSILQKQDNKGLGNTTSVSTSTLTSSGYGDYAVTYHEFRYQSGSSLSTAYTSDNGARSCSAAWNGFVYSC